MEVVNGKDLVCLFTSSFAFVFFPFFFSSYIMKCSFLVTLSQPVIWQGDNLHILHGSDGLMGVLF